MFSGAKMLVVRDASGFFRGFQRAFPEKRGAISHPTFAAATAIDGPIEILKNKQLSLQTNPP